MRFSWRFVSLLVLLALCLLQAYRWFLFPRSTEIFYLLYAWRSAVLRFGLLDSQLLIAKALEVAVPAFFFIGLRRLLCVWLGEAAAFWGLLVMFVSFRLFDALGSHLLITLALACVCIAASLYKFGDVSFGDASPGDVSMRDRFFRSPLLRKIILPAALIIGLLGGREGVLRSVFTLRNPMTGMIGHYRQTADFIRQNTKQDALIASVIEHQDVIFAVLSGRRISPAGTADPIAAADIVILPQDPADLSVRAIAQRYQLRLIATSRYFAIFKKQGTRP